MATRGQGLAAGCFVVVASFLVLMAVGSLLLGRLWSVEDVNPFGEGKVGLVVIEGPIDDAQPWIDEIDANRTDASIQAVVLRVNSPGGQVGPSQELYEAILRLRAEKPVIASLGSVAASGGYYAAVAADSIVANPGTLTGSIGVIFSFPDMSELMEKVGIRYQVYKSGELKDIGTFTRAPSEAEEDVLDAIIDDVYDQFVDAVTEGRGLPRADVLALADGRIFTGRQAREAGLVDTLGDLEAATLMAARAAGISGSPRVVRKVRPRIPLLELVDQLLRGGVALDPSPRLEYRYR